MDRAIFHLINRWPESFAPAMRTFSEGLNSPGMKGLLAVIVVALLAAGKETRRAAILALIAFPLADGATNVLKHAFPTLRPCNDPSLNDCILRIGASQSSGTASAHAANTVAIATVFLLTLRWYGAPWAALAILVGLSRIYNGVHYPWQVGLGWLVGILVAGLVVVVGRQVERFVGRRRGDRGTDGANGAGREDAGVTAEGAA